MTAQLLPNQIRQMGHSKTPTWKLQFWYAQFSVNLIGCLGKHRGQVKRIKVSSYLCH